MEGGNMRESFLLAVASQRFGVSSEQLLAAYDQFSRGSSLTEFLSSILSDGGPQTSTSRPQSVHRWPLEDGITPRSSSTPLRSLRRTATAAGAARLASKVVVPSPRAPIQQLDRLSEVGEGDSSSPDQLYDEQQPAQPQVFYNTAYEADQPVMVANAETAFQAFPFGNPLPSQVGGAFGQQHTTAGPPGVPTQPTPQQQPVDDNAAATRVQQQASSTPPAAQAAPVMPLEELGMYQEAVNCRQALQGCQQDLHSCQQQLQSARAQLTASQQQMYVQQQRIQELEQLNRQLQTAVLAGVTPTPVPADNHVPTPQLQQPSVPQQSVQTAPQQPVSLQPAQPVPPPQQQQQQSVQPVPQQPVPQQPAASQAPSGVTGTLPGTDLKQFTQAHATASSLARSMLDEYDGKRPVDSWRKKLVSWLTELDKIGATPHLSPTVLAGMAKGRISSKFLTSRAKGVDAVTYPSSIESLLDALTALQSSNVEGLQLQLTQVYHNFLPQGSDLVKCYSALTAVYEGRAMDTPTGADILGVLYVFGATRTRRLKELLSSRCPVESDYTWALLLTCVEALKIEEELEAAEEDRRRQRQPPGLAAAGQQPPPPPQQQQPYRQQQQQQQQPPRHRHPMAGRDRGDNRQPAADADADGDLGPPQSGPAVRPQGAAGLYTCSAGQRMVVNHLSNTGLGSSLGGSVNFSQGFEALRQAQRDRRRRSLHRGQQLRDARLDVLDNSSSSCSSSSTRPRLVAAGGALPMGHSAARPTPDPAEEAAHLQAAALAAQQWSAACASGVGHAVTAAGAAAGSTAAGPGRHVTWADDTAGGGSSSAGCSTTAVTSSSTDQHTPTQGVSAGGEQLSGGDSRGASADHDAALRELMRESVDFAASFEQLAAVGSALALAGRRPRNAEAVGPDDDKPATQPRLDLQQIARIVSSFRRAALALTVGDLAAIEGRPELAPFKELLAAMYAVFAQMQEQFPSLSAAAGHMSMALSALPDWVMEPSATPPDPVPPAQQQQWAPSKPPDSTAAVVQCSSSSSSPSAGKARVSLGLGCQARMPGVSIGCRPKATVTGAFADVSKPYLAAACLRSLHVSVVGMSYFAVGLPGPRGHIRKSTSSLDSGCSINSMSESHFLQVGHHICGPDSPAQLCELEEPVTISLFAGEHSTVATHCVTGLPLHIGKGIYLVDLLIVKGGNFNMVLGNNFLYDYAGRVWCRDFGDRQAGRYLQLPLTERLCQPGVTPPSPPASKGPHWYPSQRVPMSYEVFTDTWRVRPVSTYASA